MAILAACNLIAGEVSSKVVYISLNAVHSFTWLKQNQLSITKTTKIAIYFRFKTTRQNKTTEEGITVFTHSVEDSSSERVRRKWVIVFS